MRRGEAATKGSEYSAQRRKGRQSSENKRIFLREFAWGHRAVIPSTGEGSKIKKNFSRSLPLSNGEWVEMTFFILAPLRLCASIPVFQLRLCRPAAFA
jgi:hypothetical protein